MRPKYHIVPSTGEAKPCTAYKVKCKYKNSIHADTAEDAKYLYEKSMSDKTITKINKRKSEFNTISNSFPSLEIIQKYTNIVEKYGEDSLSNLNSLVDHPELFRNPSELFLLYSFMNAQQKASSIEKFIFKNSVAKK